MVPDPETGEGDTLGERGDLDCCKVGRTAMEFEIPAAVPEIADRRREGSSYRDIAAHFNTRVVDRALERADIEDSQSVHAALVGSDIASDVYRVLRANGDWNIRRAELRARLVDSGVDVDALESALVSHVTIRSHLQKCADVEREESPPPFEQTVNTTQWAQTRASNIVQSALDRAVRHEQLRTGPLEAEIVVRITCDDCGDTFYLTELLDRRQCSCALANQSNT